MRVGDLPRLVHDMREGLLAVQCTEQHAMDCRGVTRRGAGRNIAIITQGLTSLVAGGLGLSQNRGVTLAPAASIETLDDMPSTGENSNDFRGPASKKKSSSRKNTSWKIGGWSSKIFPCARQTVRF